MNILPSELHEKIFSQLAEEQMLQCMLVCRQWRYNVRPYVYSSINIRLQSTLDKFMKTIMADISLGRLVLHLEINHRCDNVFHIRLLCRLFPNLRTMNLPFKCINEDSSENGIVNTRLESVLQLDDHELSQHLISLNEQDGLPTLHALTLHEHQHLVSQLGSFPCLVDLELHLDDFSLTMADLENLHENSPSLQHLYLKNIMFSPSDEMPSRIIPNPNVVSIDWGFSIINGAQIFQYIEQKYPNLEDIRMKYDDYDSYDSSNVDEETHIFEEGWLPLLKSRGSQLLRIKGMGVKQDTNIFSILDDYGCQLELLDIYCEMGLIQVDDFLQSQQRHSLLHLYIRDGDQCHIGSFRDTKLETLSLYFSEFCGPHKDYPQETILLDHFIKQCPDTLKELALLCAIVGLGDVDEGADFQSSITSIRVNNQPGNLGYCYCTEEDGYDAIAKLCPNIESWSIVNL